MGGKQEEEEEEEEQEERRREREEKMCRCINYSKNTWGDRIFYLIFLLLVCQGEAVKASDIFTFLLHYLFPEKKCP